MCSSSEHWGLWFYILDYILKQSISNTFMIIIMCYLPRTGWLKWICNMYFILIIQGICLHCFFFLYPPICDSIFVFHVFFYFQLFHSTYCLDIMSLTLIKIIELTCPSLVFFFFFISVIKYFIKSYKVWKYIFFQFLLGPLVCWRG